MLCKSDPFSLNDTKVMNEKRQTSGYHSFRKSSIQYEMGKINDIIINNETN